VNRPFHEFDRPAPSSWISIHGEANVSAHRTASQLKPLDN
jgi:hypothetical protein